MATGRRLGANLTGAEAAFITEPGKHIGWVVLSPGASEDTVAHEAAHAIRALFDSRGVTLEDEAFAYHLGYLMGKIHGFIRLGPHEPHTRPTLRWTLLTSLRPHASS